MNGILLGETEERTYGKSLVFILVIILTSSGFFICFFNKFQRVRKSCAASYCTNTGQAENNLNQYYQECQACFPQMAKVDLFFPIGMCVLFHCHLLPGTELSLETATVSSRDLSKQWEKMGGLKYPTELPTARGTSLSVGHRAQHMPITYHRIGLTDASWSWASLFK